MSSRWMKLMVAGLVVAFAAAGLAKADSTNVVTNAMGQVITTVVDASEGTTTITIVDPYVTAAPERDTITLIGAQLASDTDLDANTGNYTPRDIGDLLIGLLSTNGVVYIANGVATNDWVELSN